jgi:hypothetical protein
MPRIKEHKPSEKEILDKFQLYLELIADDEKIKDDEFRSMMRAINGCKQIIKQLYHPETITTK